MHDYLGDGSPLAFAHRGGAQENAENTLEAFEHAIGLGFHYIESDVQATSDGVLVMFHDLTLSRLVGQAGRIKDLTWAEVQQLKVLGTGTIPRFEDVLTNWPDVRFNLDAKTADAVAPLCQLMEERQVFDRICLASFSDRSINAIRDSVGPQLCTAAAQGEALRFIFDARLGLDPAPLRADCLQIPPSAIGFQMITPRVLAAAEKVGVAVHAWTIDEEAEMRRLLEQGVGGIMTDRPSVLNNVMNLS